MHEFLVLISLQMQWGIWFKYRNHRNSDKKLLSSVPLISILSACHYKTIEPGFDQNEIKKWKKSFEHLEN